MKGEKLEGKKQTGRENKRKIGELEEIQKKMFVFFCL